MFIRLTTGGQIPAAVALKMTNHSIELIDFHDRDKKREYVYTSSDTIGDLKRNIAQKEGYGGQETLNIILGFISLPDDLCIKDIIDLEEHGLFIEFPTYARVTSNEDIYVWAGKSNCKKLYAGVEESFEVRWNGNFGVARNKYVFRSTFTCHRRALNSYIFRVGPGKYDVRVYKVKNGWTLRIFVDNLNIQVSKIENENTKKEKKTELKPYTLKTYENEKKSVLTHQNVREVFKTVETGVRAVRQIPDLVQGATDETNEPVGLSEGSSPSDTSDRTGTFFSRCPIL